MRRDARATRSRPLALPQPPHGKSRSSPAFQAFGFCKRRRLPAAGAGAEAALALLSLAVAADGFVLLAAVFLCAGYG